MTACNGNLLEGVTNSRGGLTLYIKGKTRGGLSVRYIGYFAVTLWYVWSYSRWNLVEGMSRTAGLESLWSIYVQRRYPFSLSEHS